MHNDGPYEDELEDQIKQSIREAIDQNSAVLRAAVLNACPQAIVAAGELKIKNIEYYPTRTGSLLTASIRYPIYVTIPMGYEDMEEDVDEAVIELEPVADSHGYLTGLEWTAPISYGSTITYVLEGDFKKED